MVKDRVWDKKTLEISKTKHVAVSENLNRAALRILKRMLGTPRSPYQEKFLLSKYKDTSIWHQRSEGF